MDIVNRIKAILAAEAAAIMSVPVDGAFERAIRALETCSGKVVITGMGKAGHVAKKFAAILCSTGTPAAYIHPDEAAHGDLGLITRGIVSLRFRRVERPLKYWR